VGCSDGTFYIGKTSDLGRRIKKHNRELPGGAKYTKYRYPVVLRYYEQYFIHKEAFHREYILKQIPRAKKKILIEEFNVCLLPDRENIL
jgi:putative endonuclease